MTSTSPGLIKLRATALKNINTHLGLARTGNKTALVSALTNLSPPPLLSPAASILSLDMGIRNLAYCVLSPTSPWPTITHWERLLLPLPDALDLPVYAAEAHSLVSRLLEAHAGIDAVLIERQRWRSNSSSAVLQWTIKVNTLESMLFAVFIGRRYKVEAVDPLAVAKSWGLGAKSRGLGAKDSTGKKKKKGKIKIFGRLLERGEVLVGGGGGGGGGGVGGGVGLEQVVENVMRGKLQGKGKVDDLVDCALQAVTWTQWMQRRREFLESGVESVPVEVLEGRELQEEEEEEDE